MCCFFIGKEFIRIHIFVSYKIRKYDIYIRGKIKYLPGYQRGYKE